jgi:hypothetical protein
MTITFPCSGCGKKYKVESHLAGKKIKCKQCGAVVDIPVPRQPGTTPTPSESHSQARQPSHSTWSALGPREFAMPASARREPSQKAAEPPRPETTETRCPHCGALSRIRPEWRGLDLECPTCRRQFIVPGDPAAPAARAATGRDRGVVTEAPVDRGSLAALRDAELFDLQAAPAAPLPPPVIAPGMSSLTVELERDRRRRSSSSHGAGGWLIGLAATVVLLVVAWALLPSTGVGVLAAVVFGTSMLLMLAGGIWMLVVAFQESPLCGLFYFIDCTNIYRIYYLITRWDETKRPFLTNLAGVGLLFLSGAMALSTGVLSDVAGPRRPFGPDRQWDPGRPLTRAEQRQADWQSKMQEFGPERTVTINVSGVADSDASYYIMEKLRALAGTGHYSRFSESGPSMTAVLAPVDDAQAFAARIDFGKVSVRGQQISVEVDSSKLPPRRPPPAGTDPVSVACWDVGSPNPTRRRVGAHRLAEIPPNERRAEVRRVLEPLLKDQEAGPRSAAVKALAAWLGNDAVPALVNLLRDPDNEVFSQTVDALERLGDERAIEPIAACLVRDRDRSKAGDALRKMGPVVEPEVLKYLEHRDERVREEACEILKAVGSEQSVAPLQALAKRGERRAQGALEEIARRSPEMKIEVPDAGVAEQRQFFGDKQRVEWRVTPDPLPETIDIPSDLKISIPLPGGWKGNVLFPTTPSPYLAVVGNVNRTDVCDVWDIRTAKRLNSVRGKIALDAPFVLSPDGAYLAGKVPFGRGRGIEVWSVRTSQPVARVEAMHTDAFDFAAQNQLVVMGFAALQFEVWNLASGRRVLEIKPKHPADRESLALSPGRRYLAMVTSWDGALRIHDLVGGMAAGDLQLPLVRGVRCKGLMFSMDGAELAGFFEIDGKGRIIAWDLRSGQVAADHSFPTNLKDRIAGAAQYGGRSIEWLPDRSGWLLYGHGLVARSSGELLATLEIDPAGSALPRLVASLDHVISVTGETKPAVQSFPLPKEKLAAAAAKEDNSK